MRLICGEDHQLPSFSLALPAIRQLALATAKVLIKFGPMAISRPKQSEPNLAADINLTVIVIDIAIVPRVMPIFAIVPEVTPISATAPEAMAISRG